MLLANVDRRSQKSWKDGLFKLNNLVCKLVQAINVKIQKNKESMYFENQISVLNVPGSFQVS